jgi:hypothetical protein
MSDRITQRDLEAVCARINRTVNWQLAQSEDAADKSGTFHVWTRDEDGLHQVPNVYTISYAYGGAALHRNCDVNGDGESHGVSDVFGYHMPKRDLYERMQAFLRGIEATA